MTSIPARAGLCWQTAGFWRPRGPPGGSARPAASPRSSARTNQEAAGRGRGRARRVGPGRSEILPRAQLGWSCGVRAVRFPAGHGAADVASGRRGGRGRLPGVPEVRRALRGARRDEARRSPAWARDPFPGGLLGTLPLISSCVVL